MTLVDVQAKVTTTPPFYFKVADLVCYSTSPAALVHVLKEGDLLTWGKKQKIGMKLTKLTFTFQVQEL